MNRKADQSYFDRLEAEVQAAYERMENYTPEQIAGLREFAQVLLGTPLV